MIAECSTQGEAVKGRVVFLRARIRSATLHGTAPEEISTLKPLTASPWVLLGNQEEVKAGCAVTLGHKDESSAPPHGGALLVGAALRAAV